MVNGAKFSRLPILLVVVIFAGAVSAQDQAGIPEAERLTADDKGFAGPSETQGIESSVLLGSIPLGEDFPALDGRVLRARIVTMLPGGTVEAHEHVRRPGIAYILEGEMTEYRNDQSGPVVRGTGAVSLEKSGVVHWWVNESAGKARAIVVDIVEGNPE